MPLNPPTGTAICSISVLAVIMTGILPAWSSGATLILSRRSFRIPEPGGPTNITGNLSAGMKDRSRILFPSGFSGQF